MMCVVCSSLLLTDMWCMLVYVRCCCLPLFVARCCCLLFVVCCLLVVVCCLVFIGCSLLLVVRCVLCVYCCKRLDVGGYPLCDVDCSVLVVSRVLLFDVHHCLVFCVC